MDLSQPSRHEFDPLSGRTAPASRRAATAEPGRGVRPDRPTVAERPTVATAGEIGARVLDEGRRAPLEDVLHAVAVNALGPDSRVALSREEWARVEELILAPVAAAARAALVRLAADLDTALPARVPELTRRIGDQRLKAELGYD